MGILGNLSVKIAAKAASDTVVKVGARMLRDLKKYNEGHAAGHKEGYNEGYKDAKAGKPSRY